jgi:hypothetical protein
MNEPLQDPAAPDEPWFLPPCDPEAAFDAPAIVTPTRAAAPAEASPVSSTDQALAAWRDVTVARRAAWEQEEARRTQRIVASARAAGVGVALLLTGGAAFAAVRVLTGPAAIPPTPVVAPAPPPGEAHAPATTLRAAPAPTSAAGPVVVPGSEKVFWSEGKAWTQVDVAGHAPAELRWSDAAGKPVLDPWPCRGRHDDTIRCMSARWPARLDAALADGAAPGSWTVSVCNDVACTPVGALTVPAP